MQPTKTYFASFNSPLRLTQMPFLEIQTPFRHACAETSLPALIFTFYPKIPEHIPFQYVHS